MWKRYKLFLIIIGICWVGCAGGRLNVASSQQVHSGQNQSSDAEKVQPSPAAEQIGTELWPGSSSETVCKKGLVLRYAVNLNTAVANERDSLIQHIKHHLVEYAGLSAVKSVVDDQQSHQFQLEFESEKVLKSAIVQEVLGSFIHNVKIQRGDSKVRPDGTIGFALLDSKVASLQQKALKQVKKVVANRVNTAGIRSVQVSVQERFIQIEFQGASRKAVNAVKDLIAKPGKLFLRIVDDAGSTEAVDNMADAISAAESLITVRTETDYQRGGESKYLSAKDSVYADQSGQAVLVDFLKQQKLPHNRVMGIGKERVFDDDSGARHTWVWRTYYLHKAAAITEKHIASVDVAHSRHSPSPHLLVTLNPDGALLFSGLTAQNVKRRLAIQVDDIVFSAPVIQEPIPGGKFQISVYSSEAFEQSAINVQTLAKVLQSGAIEVPIKLVSEKKHDCESQIGSAK